MKDYRLDLRGHDFWQYVDQMKQAGVPDIRAEKLAICVTSYFANGGMSSAAVTEDEYHAISGSVGGGVKVNGMPYELKYEEDVLGRLMLRPVAA